MDLSVFDCTECNTLIALPVVLGEHECPNCKAKYIIVEKEGENDV